MCPPAYTWKIVITMIRVYLKYSDVLFTWLCSISEIVSVKSLLQFFHNTTDQNPFCFHPFNLYFTIGYYHNDSQSHTLSLSFLESTNLLPIHDCIFIMLLVVVQERISWLKRIWTDQQYFTCVSKNAGGWWKTMGDHGHEVWKQILFCTGPKCCRCEITM